MKITLSLLRIIQMLIDERICKTSPYTHSILDNQSVKAHVLPLNFKECICNWSIRYPSSMTLNLFYYPASCKRTEESLWHDQQDKKLTEESKTLERPSSVKCIASDKKPLKWSLLSGHVFYGRNMKCQRQNNKSGTFSRMLAYDRSMSSASSSGKEMGSCHSRSKGRREESLSNLSAQDESKRTN